MIRFKTIRWKNLLSTGNIFTEIPLDLNANVLIIGENGSGKSTILDALTFVLFGKSFRGINKPALVNSVNEKGLVVEIEFETNGKQYEVVRGIKPNIFEIYVNGALLNLDSASRDYQDYLEKFVLRMNFKSFTQIVILGSASFTPFMQMSPSDRRAVIEDLLDIQVFSVMNVIAKQRLQRNREDLEKNRIELAVKREKLIFVDKTLKSLQISSTDKKEELVKEIETLTDSIDFLRSENMKHNDSYIVLMDEYDKVDSFRKTHKQLNELKFKIEDNNARANKEIKFYEVNDVCPTCHQSIEIGFKHNTVNGLKHKCETYTDGLSKLNKQIDTCIQSISEGETLLTQSRQLEKQIEINNTKINHMITELDKVRDELDAYAEDDKLLADAKAEYETTTLEIERLEKEREDMVNDRQYIDTSINLLKDGGIKTKIIKQYLPIINKNINKYLSQMGFFVNFEINENFDETIKSRYKDVFSYYNFSEGEKMRIDLAILFTWRMIARMRNSVHTNLLILDEVFDSSLDNNGTDEFLKIMWSLIGDTNCYVISHKTDALIDRFEKVYRFEKYKNFSRIQP